MYPGQGNHLELGQVFHPFGQQCHLLLQQFHICVLCSAAYDSSRADVMACLRDTCALQHVTFSSQANSVG